MKAVTTDRESIAAIIKQRRYQMLIHSCIYYKMNDNIISDHQWSSWAKELAQLQDDYPDIAKEVTLAEYFEGWNGSSGFDLPINEPWVVAKAEWLLKLRDKKLCK